MRISFIIFGIFLLSNISAQSFKYVDFNILISTKYFCDSTEIVNYHVPTCATFQYQDNQYESRNTQTGKKITVDLDTIFEYKFDSGANAQIIVFNPEKKSNAIKQSKTAEIYGLHDSVLVILKPNIEIFGKEYLYPNYRLNFHSNDTMNIIKCINILKNEECSIVEKFDSINNNLYSILANKSFEEYGFKEWKVYFRDIECQSKHEGLYRVDKGDEYSYIHAIIYKNNQYQVYEVADETSFPIYKLALDPTSQNYTIEYNQEEVLRFEGYLEFSGQLTLNNDNFYGTLLHDYDNQYGEEDRLFKIKGERVLSCLNNTY